MRTSYKNWNFEHRLGTVVMTGFLFLPTLSCGLGLWAQAREQGVRRAAVLEKCNVVAAQSNADEAALPDVAAGSALSRELRGLRPELEPSGAAREAFAACMDMSAFDGFPRPLNAGTGAVPPASARRTH